MRLHHVAIATKDIEKTSKLLCHFGYVSGEIKFDQEQKVYVRFLEHSDAPRIELVFARKGVDSPVDKIIEKNGTCVYHLCYEVENIDRAVEELREQGYFPIGRKTKSVIDDRNVMFLFHTDNCLIELLGEKEV